MAGAAYAHADGFGYSGKLQVGWGFPFAGVEGEAIFGEKQAGFLLLDGAVVGDHGWFGAGGLGLSLRLGCGWRTVAIETERIKLAHWIFFWWSQDNIILENHRRGV